MPHVGIRLLFSGVALIADKHMIGWFIDGLFIACTICLCLDYAALRTEAEIKRHVLTPIPVQPISADGAIALLGHFPEHQAAGPDQWFNWQKGWVDDNQHRRVGGKLRNGRL